eukprot:7021145-Alexandrium_andersonii.AAC.1
MPSLTRAALCGSSRGVSSSRGIEFGIPTATTPSSRTSQAILRRWTLRRPPIWSRSFRALSGIRPTPPRPTPRPSSAARPP